MLAIASFINGSSKQNLTFDLRKKNWNKIKIPGKSAVKNPASQAKKRLLCSCSARLLLYVFVLFALVYLVFSELQCSHNHHIMSSHEEGARTTRRSLKTLQHSASDRENLVGRQSKSLKHQLTQDTPVSDISPEVKRKNLSSRETQATPEVKRKNVSKETQASIANKITVEDLTNPKGASEKYWEVLAGKRQVALQDALDENEKLRKIIEDLKEENAMIKQMLDEANTFVEVIKEELNGTNNDTGIDVNDVSTADEISTFDNTTEDEEA